MYSSEEVTRKIYRHFPWSSRWYETSIKTLKIIGKILEILTRVSFIILSIIVVFRITTESVETDNLLLIAIFIVVSANFIRNISKKT